jgi:hypothetical protein
MAVAVDDLTVKDRCRQARLLSKTRLVAIVCARAPGAEADEGHKDLLSSNKSQGKKSVLRRMRREEEISVGGMTRCGRLLGDSRRGADTSLAQEVNPN